MRAFNKCIQSKTWNAFVETTIHRSQQPNKRQPLALTHCAHSRLFISRFSKEKLSPIHAESGSKKSPRKLSSPIWTLPLLPTFVCTHAARCSFLLPSNTKATCWRALIIMSELCSLKWMHLRDILTCDIVECWIASEIIRFWTICGIWWIFVWFENASKIGWDRC